MTDLVKRGRRLAGNVSLNRQLGGFEWEGEDAQTIGELCDEIERLKGKLLVAEVEYVTAGVVAKKELLDDMRERLPEHPPLRGPIKAFLDDYEKE